MFCENCGYPIGEGMAFCTSCGARIANGVPAAPPVRPPVQPAIPQPYPYQPGYAVSPVPPTVPRHAEAPADAVGKQPLIAKGGYIAAIILSAVAMSVFILSLLGDFSDLFTGEAYSITYVDIMRWLFCFIPFFVLCLLLKKIPAVITAIPLAFILLERTIAAMSSIFRFDVFDVEYSFTGIELLFLSAAFAGVVMYFITLLIKSRPLVMKIITAVLLGVYALYILYDIVRLASYDFYIYLSTEAIIGWYAYDLGFICLFSAMIVIVFTSKAKKRNTM